MLSSPSGVIRQARHLLHTSQLKNLWSSALHLHKRLLARSSLLLPPLPLAPPTVSRHAPPLLLQCAGGRPVARQDDSIVPKYPSYLNLNSSPQSLPSSLQRRSFLTDIRSCTPDYSPPASPLHRRAPSEDTTVLYFTLTKQRETPDLQNSPGELLIAIPYSYRLNDPILTVPSGFPLYPEDPNYAPSPRLP